MQRHRGIETVVERVNDAGLPMHDLPLHNVVSSIEACAGDEIGFAQPRWASQEQKNGSDYANNRDNFGPGGTGGMM